MIPFVLIELGCAGDVAISTAAMNAVSVQKSGVASGVLQMSRMIGASVGIAATGAIFQAQLGSGFDPGKLAAAPEQARATFVDALSSAMLLAGIVVVAGLVVSLTLVRGARTKRVDSREAAEESVAAVPVATVAEDVAGTSSRPARARRRGGCWRLAASPPRPRGWARILDRLGRGVEASRPQLIPDARSCPGSTAPSPMVQKAKA